MAGISSAAGVASALLATGFIAACAPHETAADLVESGSDTAAVAAASADAAKTLNLFWDKLDHHEAGASDFMVKLAMKTKGGGTEFIWAEPLSHSDQEIVARLANDPVHLGNLSFGSVVHVAPSLIADWCYEKNGKLYGHYTTRVLLPRMTPEERAEASNLAPTPLEPTDH